jgi:hypothetical protein
MHFFFNIVLILHAKNCPGQNLIMLNVVEPLINVLYIYGKCRIYFNIFRTMLTINHNRPEVYDSWCNHLD